jgi:hypothetical protein
MSWENVIRLTRHSTDGDNNAPCKIAARSTIHASGACQVVPSVKDSSHIRTFYNYNALRLSTLLGDETNHNGCHGGQHQAATLVKDSNLVALQLVDIFYSYRSMTRTSSCWKSRAVSGAVC